MELKNQIKKLATKYYPEIIDIRRHLHANPELSFQEFETSAFICKNLDEWKIPYKTGFAGTGIVATLDGAGPGRIIGLRADMDALPIQEENDISFKSKNPGKMHACGHDVHVSCLLGSIRILQEIKSQWHGKIKFVFQPAEERVPGGANMMIQENAFGSEEPEIMIAQHVYTDMKVGNVGFRPGIYMASSDEIFIKVKGKGGHGALPDKLTDPVLISAYLLSSLQQVVSRNAKPGIPTVLSFGKVIANGSVNIIPDEVSIEGTLRTMNEEWREQAHSLIKKICENIVEGMGGKVEIEIRHGYPLLVNDHEVTANASDFAKDFLGDTKVEDLEIRMTAEDFAYFAQKYPSVLFRLGTSDNPGKDGALHTSRFNVNESSIELSMGLLAWMSVGFLGRT